MTPADLELRPEFSALLDRLISTLSSSGIPNFPLSSPHPTSSLFASLCHDSTSSTTSASTTTNTLKEVRDQLDRDRSAYLKSLCLVQGLADVDASTATQLSHAHCVHLCNVKDRVLHAARVPLNTPVTILGLSHSCGVSMEWTHMSCLPCDAYECTCFREDSGAFSLYLSLSLSRS